MLATIWQANTISVAAMAEKIVGGLGDGRPDSDFDKSQLAAGIRVELEHTKDRAIAKEIAKDHLTEDPNYYKKLKKMEHHESFRRFGDVLDEAINALVNEEDISDLNDKSIVVDQTAAAKAEQDTRKAKQLQQDADKAEGEAKATNDPDTWRRAVDLRKQLGSTIEASKAGVEKALTGDRVPKATSNGWSG